MELLEFEEDHVMFLRPSVRFFPDRTMIFFLLVRSIFFHNSLVFFGRHRSQDSDPRCPERCVDTVRWDKKISFLCT